MDGKFIQDSHKTLADLLWRLNYIADIKGEKSWGGIDEIHKEIQQIQNYFFDIPDEKLTEAILVLEHRVKLVEDRVYETLKPIDIVRITRSPQRFTTIDILENVYDSYTELGGEADCNVDPAIVAARAIISRKIKGKTYRHQVMVIGHEKGSGEEYRNGGSAKPWGNEKALRFMKVAEREGIPVHSFIFTPGAFPIEDYPGAAQQIARNIFEMCKLSVPIVSFISEGGSGGAEAIGVSDMRLMASYGYYSVISPEGAAAIEGKIREGQKVPSELVEMCANSLKITADQNLKLGAIDRIVEEPRLGARKENFEFYKRLRFEMIRATDEIILRTKNLKLFRSYILEMKEKREKGLPDDFDIQINWDLSEWESRKLLNLRSKKYREIGVKFFTEKKGGLINAFNIFRDRATEGYYGIKYGLIKPNQRNIQRVIDDVAEEGQVLLKTVAGKALQSIEKPVPHKESKTEEKSVFLSDWEGYFSPLVNEDGAVTCPNAHRYGCVDQWIPDLYGEFSGVCPTCGHHFPLEYHWYIKNLFDKGSIHEFNGNLSSINTLGFPGIDEKLNKAFKDTGLRSSMITFDATVEGIKVVVVMSVGDFRNGTVGACEGEKFVRACDRANVSRRPLLAYIHTTGGIRIHEGTVGVAQMPKCTMAVREYIDNGGLYIVVYDNNSFAGPVASFLGCSPYQFAIRSSKIGFAGPRVIRETTGQDIPPHYHGAKNALKRGHIHGIWDRRQFRKNLYDALITMGGPNLYYK